MWGGGGGGYYFHERVDSTHLRNHVAVVAKISKDKILAPTRFTLEKVGSFSNRDK